MVHLAINVYIFHVIYPYKHGLNFVILIITAMHIKIKIKVSEIVFKS